MLARAIMLMALAAVVYWLSHKYALDWFNLVEGGFARVPIFVFGCYLGHHVKNNTRINGKAVILGVALSAVWATLCYGWVIPSDVWWWRLPFSFGGVVFTMLFVMLLALFEWFLPCVAQLIGRALRSVGLYSLELYSTHLIVFYGGTRVLPRMGQSLSQLALYLLVACAWAWLAVRVLEPLLLNGLKLADDCWKLHSSERMFGQDNAM